MNTQLHDVDNRVTRRLVVASQIQAARRSAVSPNRKFHDPVFEGIGRN